ncbi:MAG: hypothetical protein EAZ85_11055 [Bacteroidetes bacterium]|nr:MAG: hypothetical protein EAZ85_11055 [Bacteroidota bacterium]TAG89704.1 MAG: hypothetical protein EAZ20_05935 [Bacteroidota bacterium]
MLRILFFYFTMYLFHSVLFSQKKELEVIDVSKINEKNYLLKDKIGFIEDKTAQLSFHQIKSAFDAQQFNFIKDPSQVYFGRTQSSVWFCFKLQNKPFDELKKWIIKNEHPSLDYIDFYYRDKSGNWQTIYSGDKKKFSERDILSSRLFAFHLPLYSDAVHTFYIRIKSDGILMNPMVFYESEHYYAYSVYEETLFGAYFGIMLVLSIYNLFLYFVLRAKLYLSYVGYMFFSLLFSASITGHTFQYLFPNSSLWTEITLVLSGFLSLVMLTSFIQFFLLTKQKMKYTHRILQFVQLYCLLISVYYLFTFNYKISVGFLTLTPPAVSFYVFCVCIYAILEKKPSAQLLTFAFFSSMTGAFTYGIKQAGFLEHNFFTNNIAYFGFVLQGILFSLALANRYKQLKKELLDSQKEANQNLERKVKERTEQLEVLNKETTTQNKELQQIQGEIIVQKDAIEEKNRVLSQINAQIQSSIKAAQVIQNAIVPYQQKRDELLKEYFVVYKPKDVVSGDMYWLNQIKNTTFLVLMDCTGHGVPGAFMTLIASNLLDKIIRVWDIYNPADILERMHIEIQIILRQNETHNDYGLDASIVAITPINESEFSIEFAGAKQDLYFIQENNQQLEKLKGNRKSIGGEQSKKINFDTKQITLAKKTKLYLTSDGFLDQNNADRKKISEKVFINIITQNHTQPMNAQKQAFQQYLEDYMKGTTQRDDILVIGFEL